MAAGALPGDRMPPYPGRPVDGLTPQFPADTTTTRPAATALCTACTSGSLAAGSKIGEGLDSRAEIGRRVDAGIEDGNRNAGALRGSGSESQRRAEKVRDAGRPTAALIRGDRRVDRDRGDERMIFERVHRGQGHVD